MTDLPCDSPRLNLFYIICIDNITNSESIKMSGYPYMKTEINCRCARINHVFYLDGIINVPESAPLQIRFKVMQYISIKL